MGPENRQSPRWKGTVRKKTKPLGNIGPRRKRRKRNGRRGRETEEVSRGKLRAKTRRRETSMHLDSTKLTTLTSVDEVNLHTPTNSEGIPPSTHYNSDDDLLDYNDFVSETTS